jgi:glycosyltransferase involved in cell wall biosynthesis
VTSVPRDAHSAFRDELVSVVIPTHARPLLVPRAIRSVLSQTHSDLEVVVVDDGSTDQTREVLAGFTDPRIKVVRHEINRGVAEARNTGIRAARGRFVAFLDDDDEWLPTKVERQLEAFDAPDGPALVYSGMWIVEGSRERPVAARPQGMSFDQWLIFSGPISTSGLMVDREVAGEEFHFDPAMEGFEDGEMLLRISRRHRIGRVPEPLYRFHQHAGQRLSEPHREAAARRNFVHKFSADLAARPRAAGINQFRLAIAELRVGNAEGVRDALVTAGRADSSNRKLQALGLVAGLGPSSAVTGLRAYRALGRAKRALLGSRQGARTGPGSQGPLAQRGVRILWLIKGLGRGGAELLLSSMAEVRTRDGFDYEVAYLLPWKDALVEDLQSKGVVAHCLHGSREWDLRWAGRLRRLLRARRYDVVHVHSPYVAGIARLVVRSLPRATRPRLVSTEHLPWFGYVLPTRALNALTSRLDDARIAVSRAVVDSIPAALNGDVRVIVHGVPVGEVRAHLESRDEVRSQLGVRPDEVLLGTVANYRPQKGYFDLLRAARRVIDAAVPVRFVALGRGPLDEQIRTEHQRLGLGDRFHLAGYREDAVRVLAGCDGFVLASLFEGLPVAVMEALALGLPVVATAVGGIPECVRDGVEGLLVPPSRPDLLAEAVIDLARDPGRRARMGEAASERARRFDVGRAAREVEAIYREVARR